MAKKLYFLMYLQADHGEIELYGTSKATNRIISLDAETEPEAIAEAKKKWKKICNDARLMWSKMTNKNLKLNLRNKEFKEKGKFDKIKEIRPVICLPDWKPHDPQLISKISLEE